MKKNKGNPKLIHSFGYIPPYHFNPNQKRRLRIVQHFDQPRVIDVREFVENEEGSHYTQNGYVITKEQFQFMLENQKEILKQLDHAWENDIPDHIIESITEEDLWDKKEDRK